MKLIDVTIVWTPNTMHYQANPTAGKVAVITQPRSADEPRYSIGVGRCMTWWTHPRADRALRIVMLQSWIWYMINEDGIAPAEISRVLSEIQDLDADEVINGIDQRSGEEWLENLSFIGFAD